MWVFLEKSKSFSIYYLNNHQPTFNSAIKRTVPDPIEFQWQIILEPDWALLTLDTETCV